MSFVHLHNHSEFSLLDGLNKISDIIKTTKELGMDAIALTDHGVMYGAFNFYIKCLEAGIKPIIGMEAYVAKNSHTSKDTNEDKHRFHLTLLAKNLAGYRNLMKLTTISHLEGFYYKPRIDFELLKKHSEGIIVLSGCRNSQLNQMIIHDELKSAEKLIEQYLSVFNDDYYLEIMRTSFDETEKRLNEKLVNFSNKYAIPLVATNDVHYLRKEDAYAHEVLLCIQTQHSIQEKNRPMSMLDVPEFYLKSPASMSELFADIPSAIKNTLAIADKCDLKIPYGNWVLPNYPLENGLTSEQMLIKMVEEKKSTRVQVNKEIDERLAYELEIICQKGYATYFLVVQDCVNWAKSQKIGVGPGRGSVGGSLVAYVLNITDINPLQYNLPFERFLNPERPTPPDIDLDFADMRRDEVITYITEKYGKEKVAQIITFGRMEARMAIRDVNRALGFSYNHGDRLAKLIPQGKQGFPITIDIALKESEDLKKLYENEQDAKEVIDIAKRLEGVARHSSVHAAGLIVADKDLTFYTPLARETKGEAIITQYDMYSLDVNAASDGKAIGLLKIDVLGLRNLTILEQAIKYVEVTKNIDLTLSALPLDDKKTFQLIASGKTLGVFQLESKGMQRLAKDLSPNKISDITAMVALFRPGPMDLIPQFIEGKKDKKKIHYPHPDLKAVLEETYGVLVFQEQVMDIAVVMGRFTKSEADILRMAVGKKKKALMEQVKKKFITDCLAHGYKDGVPQEIFGFIEKFAAYGFNKAHAAAYATIAYWTAYMKANYPTQFMTALLTAELQSASGADRETKIFACFEECERLGIKVQPPDINKSRKGFSIEDNSIRFGLTAIKNVGEAAIESIVKARKEKLFQGMKDFLWRVELQKVNKRVVESLIKSGAFDQFGNRASMLNYYQILIEELSKKKDLKTKGQDDLFGDSAITDLKDELSIIKEFSISELINMEKEVISFSVGKNPISVYHDFLKSKHATPVGQISIDKVGKSLIVGGICTQVKKIITKATQKEMAFFKIYDQTGALEVVVFPTTWESYKKVLIDNNALIIKAKVDMKDENISLILEQAANLADLPK